MLAAFLFLQVMRICPEDTVLTLTSGGCNAMNLLLHGAGHVVSVDCNPAQSSLLELKQVAIQQLDYEDVWQVGKLFHLFSVLWHNINGF
jgi:betaine lipid synthase